jgi:hypothetical protein
MKNNKAFLAAGLTFVLFQAVFFSYLIFMEPKTLSLKCGSSFTRNIRGEPAINYTGEMTLMLTRNGKGNLSVEGATDESTPRTFHRAYFFDYRMDDEGFLRAKIKSSHAGASNELPEDIFSKQFFELNFKLKGGLRINKFKNVYILSTPGFIMSTCAPV